MKGAPGPDGNAGGEGAPGPAGIPGEQGPDGKQLTSIDWIHLF